MGNPNEDVSTAASLVFVRFRVPILSMKTYYSDRVLLRVCRKI
jgi:hypothetical protein